MAIDFEQGDFALADGFAQTIQLGDWPAVGDDDDVARAFTLLPGKYKIKFLARDADTGRMGTFEMRFLVPNLNQELQRIPISPVVLSSQRVDMRESLFNASKGEKGQKAQLVNPLVQDGFKLIPPVTRVFRKSADMWVYLQAYEPGVETARPVHAYVTFYQLGAVAATASRLKTIPLSFSFSLGKLDPGEYLCQVTVVDANQRKTAFWQAS